MSTRASAKQADATAGSDPVWSTRAHSLLFGPLGSTDVPTAVVHRLRAAIGLGLLPDGQRLPKEADLAAQMGITTFALREALAELRKQGLLMTRAGKNGGSFVTPGAGHDEVERAELLSLSSSELRDLADWRRMLAAHAAALAALRGSQSNIAMLREFVARVGDAKSSLEARRALGRFYLELASAAQSKRLARAEFAVHEQIDWLFGLALTNREERRAAAAALGAVVDAVRDHDADTARTAAAAQIDRLVNRLAAAATRGHRPGSSRAPAQTLDPRDRVACPDRPPDRRPRRHRRRGCSGPGAQRRSAGGPHHDVGGRAPAFRDVAGFRARHGCVAEVGVIPEPPVLDPVVAAHDDGPVEDNHHEMDPSREDFYDYETREFMTRPRETRRPFAYGPYVDYGGIDDYILTITSPVVDGDRFLGASCADILVADLESFLAPWLASTDERVLLNTDGRVIVSNAVRLSAGDMLTLREGYRVVEFPDFGWSLLTRPARTRHS